LASVACYGFENRNRARGGNGLEFDLSRGIADIPNKHAAVQRVVLSIGCQPRQARHRLENMTDCIAEMRWDRARVDHVCGGKTVCLEAPWHGAKLQKRPRGQRSLD